MGPLDDITMPPKGMVDGCAKSTTYLTARIESFLHSADLMVVFHLLVVSKGRTLQGTGECPNFCAAISARISAFPPSVYGEMAHLLGDLSCGSKGPSMPGGQKKE